MSVSSKWSEGNKCGNSLITTEDTKMKKLKNI